MKIDEVITHDNAYYMNTFGKRTPVCFDYGCGMNLFDLDGKKYYDFLGGIAVNALGHSHKKFTDALKAQIDKLIHTSSLYYILPQTQLAKALADNSCFDKAFFCSTGAEANEGAIKLAKIYHYKKQDGKSEIITLINSFHGRTLTTVAATGQEKYQKPYKPLMPGFIHVPINDIKALKKAISDKTAAIMLELVQGESGVHPINLEYIKEVRNICTNNDIILILDEVQTGIGRTGKLFGYENFDIEPDVITLAKALGGGVPIGAILAKDFVANAFEPGDHGTTFGGNPLSCSAALAVLDIIESENLLQNCIDMGIYFKSRLYELKEKYPIIKEIRGIGLILGVEFNDEIAQDLGKSLFEKGFLVGTVGKSTMRFLPPLIITKQDIDLLTTALDQLLKTGGGLNA